jgi:hypothetical protein
MNKLQAYCSYIVSLLWALVLITGCAGLVPSRKHAVPSTPEEILLEVNHLIPKIKTRFKSDTDNLYQTMARIQALMGDFDGARDSISRMELNRFMWTEDILIDGLINAGRFEEAKREAEQVGDRAIHARALGRIAWQKAREGHFEEAFGIASEMDLKYDMFNVYGGIAMEQALAGNPDGAWKTISEHLNDQSHPSGALFTKLKGVKSFVEQFFERNRG